MATQRQAATLARHKSTEEESRVNKHLSQGLRQETIARALLCSAVVAFVAVASLIGAASADSAAPGRVTIKTPGFPLHLAVGFRSIWVADHRGGYVYRIDPRTNRRVAIYVGDSLCFRPSIGAGAVWVSGCENGGVTYKIDPKTNRVVGQRKGNRPALGAGSLWTFSRDVKHVLRVDPQSGLVLARIDPKVDINTDAAQTGGYRFGSLWVISDAAVSRIDVATNKVTAVIPLPGAQPSGDVNGGYLYGDYTAFTSNAVWVTNPAGLYEIDPTANTAKLVSLDITPFSQVGDITISSAMNSIWVRTGNTSVARIDPASGNVVARYPAAGGGGGIAVAYGSLWVANAGNDTTWREPIQ